MYEKKRKEDYLFKPKDKLGKTEFRLPVKSYIPKYKGKPVTIIVEPD